MPSDTAQDRPPVRIETSGGIATLTLVAVDNRNALNSAMIAALLDAVDAVNADPNLRVLVVTNAGPVFCAGADLKEQSSGTADRAKSPGFGAVLHALQTSPTPVVGRIDGHAVGGGVGLAAACDISIARDDAKFGFTEVRVGVAPAIISLVCLPKMRRADALEAFLRGNRFLAPRAAELGLVNRAVPAAELDAAVAEVTADVVRGGPAGLAAAKRLVYEVPEMPSEAARDWAARLSAELFAGDEAAAGMAAFMAKRPAPWVPNDAAGDEA